MNFGFETWEDILKVVIVPLTVALIAVLWPEIQRRYRRRAFRQLIVRELQELKPFRPESRMDDWFEHQQKDFVHKRIFESPSENRDFILSLPTDLVYYISQLWDARAKGDHDQWLYFLRVLTKEGIVSESILEQWCRVVMEYRPNPNE